MHRGSVVLLCLVFFSVDGRLAQDGVYTAEQAARGRAVYRQQCMACHGEKLEGGEGPPLAGPVFMQLWNVPYRTLDDFYYTTSEFKPKDLPASLGERAYLDVKRSVVLAWRHRTIMYLLRPELRAARELFYFSPPDVAYPNHRRGGWDPRPKASASSVAAHQLICGLG